MKTYFEDPVLNLAASALRIFRWGALAATGVVGVIVVMVLFVSFMPGAKIFDTLSERNMIMVVMPMALIMCYILARFLKALREIVLSVREGQPLTRDNAGRLRLMGWLMLALQGATLLAIGAFAALGSGWGFDTDEAFGLVESILIAASLFILARVFDHGARMQEELEGTV